MTGLTCLWEQEHGSVKCFVSLFLIKCAHSIFSFHFYFDESANFYAIPKLNRIVTFSSPQSVVEFHIGLSTHSDRYCSPWGSYDGDLTPGIPASLPWPMLSHRGQHSSPAKVKSSIPQAPPATYSLCCIYSTLLLSCESNHRPYIKTNSVPIKLDAH